MLSPLTVFGALSLMFDEFLNVALCEDVSTTRVTQRNLELRLPTDSLDSHQTREQ